MHPRTAQMVATAESVEWIEVRNEVEALMLEYSLIKQHRPRFNVRLRDDKSYPFLAVTRRRAVAAGAGDARPQAQGHPLLRAVRPRLRDPRHARPAAAHLPDPHVQPGQVQRAPAPRPAVPAVPHREVQRPVRRRDRGDAVPAAGRRSCATSSTATPTRSSSGSTAEHAGGGDRARVRAGRPAARPAHRGAAGDREAADGRRPQRGHRRHRPRRRRPRSGGAGVLRPQGPGRRAQGLHPRQGRGPLARRAGRPHPRGAVRRRAAARRAEAGARAGRARTTWRRTRSG